MFYPYEKGVGGETRGAVQGNGAFSKEFDCLS